MSYPKFKPIDQPKIAKIARRHDSDIPEPTFLPTQNTSSQITEKILSLRKEAQAVTSKLQSLKKNLSLKEKESELLRYTLERLQSKSLTNDSSSKANICSCSKQCIIF